MGLGQWMWADWGTAVGAQPARVILDRGAFQGADRSSFDSCLAAAATVQHVQSCLWPGHSLGAPGWGIMFLCMKGARAGLCPDSPGEPATCGAGTSCAGTRASIVVGVAAHQQQDRDDSAHPIPGCAMQGVAGLQCVNKGPIQGWHGVAAGEAALGSTVPPIMPKS